MSPNEYLTFFGGAGGGGAIIFVILFLTNQVYTKGAYDEIRKDRDGWKKIAEIERARADASVMAALAVGRDVTATVRRELE